MRTVHDLFRTEEPGGTSGHGRNRELLRLGGLLHAGLGGDDVLDGRLGLLGGLGRRREGVLLLLLGDCVLLEQRLRGRRDFGMVGGRAATGFDGVITGAGLRAGRGSSGGRGRRRRGGRRPRGAVLRGRPRRRPLIPWAAGTRNFFGAGSAAAAASAASAASSASV